VFGYSEGNPHASVYLRHEQAHYRPVKPDAVLKSLEFDTPNRGPYFVNFPDSGVVAWDPLKWFEILGLTERDEQRSNLPSLYPIDILQSSPILLRSSCHAFTTFTCWFLSVMIKSFHLPSHVQEVAAF